MTDQLRVPDNEVHNLNAALSVRGLSKFFGSRYGDQRKSARGAIRALDGVSFDLPKGATLGIVGESGCGKSTLARCLVRLEEPSSGEILLDGDDILRLSLRQFRSVRSRIQLVFQDPYGALTPRRSVGEQVGEPLRVHRLATSRKSIDGQVGDLLERVGLRASDSSRYPREFSGGQRQRVCIARALASKPEVLILDEPVSALDVSVQAQIINLLRDLQEEYELSMIFISHDLSVVEEISEHLAVMYLGRVVEDGSSSEIFSQPLHPYSQALLSAAPIRTPAERGVRERIVLSGDVPSPASPPSGCHFRTRCWLALSECAEEVPLLRTLTGKDHRCACIRALDTEGRVIVNN